jgi:hypothetical protein
MKALPIVAAVLGIGVMLALVGYFGAGAVVRSLLAVGGIGFAAICAIHLALMVVMGFAWRVLMPSAPSWVAIWGRLVRDSGSEVLPLSQVGGYVLGARALALAGVTGTVATASTIVDVTFEFVAQVGYTALGLVLLLQLQPDSAVATPVIIGLAVAVAAAVAFLIVQRHGFDYFERIARILGRGWAERSAAGAAALHGALRVLDCQRGRSVACLALGGRAIAVQRRAGAGEHAVRGANIGVCRAERGWRAGRRLHPARRHIWVEPGDGVGAVSAETCPRSGDRLANDRRLAGAGGRAVMAAPKYCRNQSGARRITGLTISRLGGEPRGC